MKNYFLKVISYRVISYSFSKISRYLYGYLKSNDLLLLRYFLNSETRSVQKILLHFFV